MVILGKTKVKDALDENPELKELLISLSPKFEKLNNKFIFNTVGRWATFNDIAKMGGLSVCVILHKLNEAAGTVKELESVFPECINEIPRKQPVEEKPEWVDNIRQIVVMDVRNRNDFFYTEIINQLKQLKENSALKVINTFYPAPLTEMLKEEGYEFYVGNPFPEEYELYIKRKDEDPDKNWRERKESFEDFDVRKSKEDPFGAIVKKAQETAPGQGFKLIQKFEPVPLINMLIPMGFEHETVKKDFFEYHIYFYKTMAAAEEEFIPLEDKIPIVVQTATPVVLPIVMELLKSKKLMDRVQIRELKVWRETEKHMAWIVNERADITFSAVAAAAKLFVTGNDIKMASIDIWDNFYVLTRGYEAKTFSDLKGHDFYIPLYKEAPPYAVTDYLMKKLGEDPNEYNFVFGNPFGRPEEMQHKLVRGEIDTVLLREPEASFALSAGKGEIKEAFAYSDLWKEIHGTEGRLPNAGLIIKGKLAKEHPEIVEIFYEELEKTIKWINENPKQAAEQAYDLMGGSVEALELFMNRVTFRHEKASERIDDIVEYLKILGSGKPFSYVGEHEEVREMFKL